MQPAVLAVLPTIEILVLIPMPRLCGLVHARVIVVTLTQTEGQELLAVHAIRPEIRVHRRV